MTYRRMAIEPEQLQKGVFQTGRAQIAREMESRLNITNPDDDDYRRPRYRAGDRWWQ